MNSSAATHPAGPDVGDGDTANTEPGQGLGADLLAVVARLNRLATQRIQMPLPSAQARLLATIEMQGEARIGDLAAVDHCSQPTMTTQVRRLEEAGLVDPNRRPRGCPGGPNPHHASGGAHVVRGAD